MVETDRLLGRVLRRNAPGGRTPDAGCLGNRNSMSNQNPTGKERTDRRPAHRNELAAAATEKTLKRARWEHLRLAACPGARRVNVTNYSYGVAGVRSGEHTYTVTVAVDGQPNDCTCPAAEYQPGPCKHAVRVADAPEIVAEAMHEDSEPEPTAAADAPRALADGGRVESIESESESELPAIVDCDDDPHRARCEGCGATGPKGLGDDGPAILHECGCPHGEGSR